MEVREKVAEYLYNAGFDEGYIEFKNISVNTQIMLLEQADAIITIIANSKVLACSGCGCCKK